jgi:hypothetical protein
MKRLYPASNPADAHMVRGFLEAQGIEAIVQGEHLFGLRGEVPVPETYPSVWVIQESDFERAKELLEEVRSKENEG